MGPSSPGPTRQAKGRLCDGLTPGVEKQSPREDDVPEATTGWTVDTGRPFLLSTRPLHLAVWPGTDTGHCFRDVDMGQSWEGSQDGAAGGDTMWDTV